MKMIVTTLDSIPGKNITRLCRLVEGSTVTTKHGMVKTEHLRRVEADRRGGVEGLHRNDERGAHGGDAADDPGGRGNGRERNSRRAHHHFRDHAIGFRSARLRHGSGRLITPSFSKRDSGIRPRGEYMQAYTKGAAGSRPFANTVNSGLRADLSPRPLNRATSDTRRCRARPCGRLPWRE